MNIFNFRLTFRTALRVILVCTGLLFQLILYRQIPILRNKLEEVHCIGIFLQIFMWYNSDHNWNSCQKGFLFIDKATHPYTTNYRKSKTRCKNVREMGARPPPSPFSTPFYFYSYFYVLFFFFTSMISALRTLFCSRVFHFFVVGFYFRFLF